MKPYKQQGSGHSFRRADSVQQRLLHLETQVETLASAGWVDTDEYDYMMSALRKLRLLSQGVKNRIEASFERPYNRD